MTVFEILDDRANATTRPSLSGEFRDRSQHGPDRVGKEDDAEPGEDDRAGSGDHWRESVDATTSADERGRKRHDPQEDPAEKGDE